MKKVLSKILLSILPFLFITSVNAASSSIAVSSSTSQVIVGKNVTVYVTVSSSKALGAWEYTLNYDKNIFKLVSSDVDLHYVGYVSNKTTKSVTYKYNFTALKSGSSRFYIDSSDVLDIDENRLSVSDGSKTIKAITAAEYQASLSKNNNLKSLEVAGYEIDPAFDKDTLEYNVKVNEDETKINIKATVEDKTATVNGAGEVEVSAGNNVFTITVIAQNGSEKTYKLNVEVVDKNPINVEVDGKKYTIVKIASNLTKPESYTEKTIKIDEFDIPAFYSEITEFTLVGLKDEEGSVSLYIYEDGKYTKYTELNFGNITLYPLELKETIKKYKKYEVTIQNEKLYALSLKEDSRFKLIYAMNVENKETGLYIYDSKDNTAVKYDSEYIDILNHDNKIILYIAILFASTTFISLIVLILQNSKKKTKKVKEVKEVKEEIPDDNEIIETKPKKKKKSN